MTDTPAPAPAPHGRPVLLGAVVLAWCALVVGAAALLIACVTDRAEILLGAVALVLVAAGTALRATGGTGGAR